MQQVVMSTFPNHSHALPCSNWGAERLVESAGYHMSLMQYNYGPSTVILSLSFPGRIRIFL